MQVTCICELTVIFDLNLEIGVPGLSRSWYMWCPVAQHRNGLSYHDSDHRHGTHAHDVYTFDVYVGRPPCSLLLQIIKVGETQSIRLTRILGTVLSSCGEPVVRRGEAEAA
jgi:hypothetical protein